MEVMIKEARAAFVVLGEPERYQNNPANKPRWGVVFLIKPGSDDAKAIDAAIKQVAEEKWGAKAAKLLPGILASKQHCCWLDGDTKDYNGFAGNMALSAYRYESDGRMVVLDNDASPIYKADGSFYEGKAGRIFSGCWVRGKVEIWAQDNSNGKGIRSTLQVVQRLRTGDSFGGAKQASAEGFDAIDEGADADDLS